MPSTIRRFDLPPRLDLFRSDTPVQPLHRISQTLFPGEGRTLWIKRDDESGATLSGNKIRKLAYIFGQTAKIPYDTVITAGRAQSNHCRATCIAARQLGLDVELCLAEPKPQDRRGNLFLNELCGATIHWISEAAYCDLDQSLENRAQTLREAGQSPLIIPMGASNATGTLGYVECAFEIAKAQREQKADWDAIVCALGSGGTSAGLELGLRLAGLDLPLYSINICDSPEFFIPIIQTLARDCAQQFELAATVPREAIQVLGGHEGSAAIAPQTAARIRQFARHEGILLDPTYTGKAMAALIHEMQQGRLQALKNPLFIHTGGIFGLLGRGEELLSSSAAPK